MIEKHLNEDPCASHWEGAEIVVTDYESEPYAGSGCALVLRAGTVEIWELGHCSCYGPGDDVKPDKITREQFREQMGSATAPWSDAAGAAFLELLNA